MRMLKVALALLVMASFVTAAVGVSTAAIATPTMKPMATKMAMPTMKATMPNATMKAPTMGNTTVKAPGLGNATKMPQGMMGATKMPKKLIAVSEMQSNIGNIYKNLKNTVKMPGKTMNNSSTGVKSKASQIMSGTSGQMAPGQSLLRGVPAPQAISQLSGMPQLGKMVKIA